MKASGKKNIISRILTIDTKKSEKDKLKELELKKITSFVIVFISTYVAFLNFFNDNLVMAICSCLITVAFVICIILSLNVDNIPVINIIMSLAVVLVFTYLAIFNTSDIFPNIWFLIIPAICYEVINFRYGFILSLYFQILLIVLFFTPLKNRFAIDVNSSFMTYYTLTYFACFFMSTFINYKNKTNIEEIRNSLKHDHLTGLWNKEVYDERMKQMIESEEYKEGVFVYNIKINGIMDVNNKFGRQAGDALIKYAADYIRAVFNDDVYDIYRIFSGEFIVIVDEDNNNKFIDDLNNFSFTYEQEKFDNVSFNVKVTSNNEIFDDYYDAAN